MTCKWCKTPTAAYRIAGVAVEVCPKCDRIRCPACGHHDMSGRAAVCLYCRRALPTLKGAIERLRQWVDRFDGGAR